MFCEKSTVNFSSLSSIHSAVDFFAWNAFSMMTLISGGYDSNDPSSFWYSQCAYNQRYAIVNELCTPLYSADIVIVYVTETKENINNKRASSTKITSTNRS